MYLTFDLSNKEGVPDASGNHNDATFENNAQLSTRILGIHILYQFHLTKIIM